MFVGCPFGKKGWKVYDLKMGEIFVSRDVIFHGGIFSFVAQKEIEKDEWKILEENITLVLMSGMKCKCTV